MYPTPKLLPIVALLSISLSAQTPPARTAPTPSKPQPTGIAKRIPAPWEQYAVYWTAEPGWKTEIHLRNNLPSQALTVIPVLRTADGVETALPSVTVAANDIAALDVGKAIASATSQLAGGYGSLVFRYIAPVERALSAAVMIQLPGTPIEFHLDAYPPSPRPMTGGREGIWWLPRESVKDWLVLANTSDSSLTALLTLYEANGKSLRKRLRLGPRQTSRISVLSLVQRGGLVGSFGGISVDAGPRTADLDSAHFMYDEANGFLALMKMFDRDSNATVDQRSLTNPQWTIRAPMLPLTNPDPALGLPAGTTLKPAVFLRNASPSAFAAKVTFNWRSGTITGKRMLAVPLQPHATARLDIAALQANGTIPADAQWAYVNITAPIKPDELLAVATSFDSSLRFGAQTPFTDQTANHWAGGIWEVDPNHDTLIAIGNAGNTSLKARIVFHYNSGQDKYLLERTLAPDEQAWVDVSQLIGNQVPDINGKTIPPSVTSGGYDVKSVTDKPTDGLFEGKLVVDKTYGYAVHGCLLCCPEYTDLVVIPDPLDLTVGDSYSPQAEGKNICTGEEEYATVLSWDTVNQQVATGSTTQVKGVGAGSTTYFASVKVQAPNTKGECQWTSEQSSPGAVNVVPTISGPPTLWWFKGLSQGVSGYNNQITLTGSPLNGTYQWNIAAGSDKVSLSNSTTNNVQVTSIGQSTKANDVSITATVNGQTSDPFTLTVRAPYALGTDPNQRTPVYYYDPTFAWETDIYYQVLDNLLTPLPVVLPIMETFGPLIVDYSGTNWQPGPAECLPDPNSDLTFRDHIGGEHAIRIPTPVYNPNWTGVAVEHWSQDWRVGTCVPASGPRVQSDILQKWTDHALHTHIVSPAP